MSYLVVALGAFLSLCGAIAIYAGYGIIQVERGWTEVIAGATALSGGIVTIALGFILHRLSSLHALLWTGKGLMPFPRELAGHDTSEPHREHSLAFDPVASMAEAGPPPAATPSAGPAASLRPWPRHPTWFNLPLARNLLKSRGKVLPTVMGTPESDTALAKSPPSSRDALRGATPVPPFEPGLAIPAEAAAKAVDAAQTPPASAPSGQTPTGNVAREPGLFDADPWLFDEDKANEPPLEAPFPEKNPFDHRASGTQSAPRMTWPAETASLEAILGEDFRIAPDPAPALEAEKESPERPPEAIEPASLDAAPPLGSEAVPAGDPDASPKPAPPAAPFGADEGLAIVGRYASEGTSYVMYADGSIEARTEHAVLHFKSMVELKTFMESRAQTPHE